MDLVFWVAVGEDGLTEIFHGIINTLKKKSGD